MGAASAGLGLVIEFVAQQVKSRAAPHCEVPVELAAIETGGGPHGRVMIGDERRRKLRDARLQREHLTVNARERAGQAAVIGIEYGGGFRMTAAPRQRTRLFLELCALFLLL